jgi:putative ABC transport system permease protein
MLLRLDSLRADAVFGWRQLKKSKVTTAAAILSLGLAIGACTSAFRIIDALLLRPLPVDQPERLNVVAFKGPDASSGDHLEYDSCSYPMFERMRDSVAADAELVAISYADRADLTYGSDQEMERAHRQFVSGRMFSAFGIHPALGRMFTENDDLKPGVHPYAVLSFDYWVQRFGRDPSVIGRRFQMGDTLYQIVGVAGERFTGTETGTVTDIFLPMMMKNPRTLASSENFWLRTFVKLRPGAMARSVETKLSVIFRLIQAERDKKLTLQGHRLALYSEETLLLMPASAGRSNLQRDYRRALLVLAILVALVLLIACANVANLMTARAASRAREMALRVSIGAGRARLVQLVLMESAWLSIFSTAAGIIFAWWAAPFVLGMVNPPDDPARLVLPADWRVFGFGLAIATGVTALLGLIPALRASNVKPAIGLKGGDDPHSRRRLMHALIAIQVAFCFLVIFVAGLFVKTLDRLTGQATGFSAERILNLETIARHPQLPAYWDEVAQNLRAVRGVEKVALSGWPLLSGEMNVMNVAVNGGPPAEVYSDLLRVSPGWADTMKMSFLNGRDFQAAERDPGVAIVNEAFAKEYFGGRDPTGLWFDRIGSADQRLRVLVVGFVRDARTRDLRHPIRPTAWTPFYSTDALGVVRPASRGTFVVRTRARDPRALAGALRQAISQGPPEFFVDNIRTQVEINQAQTVRERLLATLGAFFATVALVLGGIGLYGVLDFSVLQRRREIGIRIAIGAQAGAIARLVTIDAFVMVLTGALAGLGLGMLSVRYIEGFFYGVKATDMSVIALPSVMIVGAVLLAALPTVVRAVRIDPLEMLRSE